MSKSTCVVALATCVHVATAAQSPTAFEITGRVVDASGNSRPGARVCAFPIDQPPGFGASCARSGVNGSFVIHPRVAGRHWIMADDPVAGHISQMRPFFRAPGFPVAEIVLEEGKPAVSVDLVLPPKNGHLVVAAVDAETGWPAEVVRLILCHASDRKTCLSSDERRDDGRFVVPAPHVPFTLRVIAPQHEPWWGPAGDNVEEPIVIGTAETREVTLRLRRRPEWVGKPISDREKTPGIHLPAPQQVSPADGTVLRLMPRRTKLEWRPVEGAASYRLELEFCDDPSIAPGCTDPKPFHPDTPPMSGITGTSYEFLFIGAQPGRWRVAAVDRDGREGFKSPWWLFVHAR